MTTGSHPTAAARAGDVFSSHRMRGLPIRVANKEDDVGFDWSRITPADLDSQARHFAWADLLRNGVVTFSGDWVPQMEVRSKGRRRLARRLERGRAGARGQVGLGS